MIVVIGDTHIKNSEPHLYGLRKFFEWLLESYKDCHIISLGDIYDVSSPYNPIEAEFIGYMKQFKSFHILEGNHTVSKRSGSGILHLQHHDNIFVYTNKTEIEIESHKFLLLPWKYNAKEDYESLKGSYDYILTHITPPQCAFGDEGIQLHLKGQYIHGHTHMLLDFMDAFKQDHRVIGVPVVTRNGENQEYRIFTIGDKLNKVKVPVFFEYQTLNYGEFPENKNNIINIKNAPSYPSVWEMYKDYNVRKEGIEILRTENEESKEDIQFEVGNIVEKFNFYAKDKNTSKEISECATRYLQEVI